MKNNWTKITERMVRIYGSLSYKGSRILILNLLCQRADEESEDVNDPNFVQYDKFYRKTTIGLSGKIPSCTDLEGTHFHSEQMACYLRGLENRYPDLCHALTTHDLNSFKIFSISELITAIRLGD